jgi:hypothetical protein
MVVKGAMNGEMFLASLLAEIFARHQPDRTALQQIQNVAA